MHNSTGSTHIDNRKILLRCEEINAMAAIEKYAHTHRNIMYRHKETMIVNFTPGKLNL